MSQQNDNGAAVKACSSDKKKTQSDAERKAWMDKRKRKMSK